MATSPNYAWAEPDNSSLVKNGAADIRTLGDAIDTSVWNIGYGQAGKNKFINGNMAIAQRGAAAQTVPASVRVFGVDRTFGSLTGAGVFTVEQVVDSPAAANAGQYSMKAVVTTADTSIAASDQYILGQIIEGSNFAQFGFGTASAQTVTISFWVKSSITGTFGVDIRNSAANRAYASTYTISVANTWEKKTVTIAGDTSGTWLQDTGIGARVEWTLSAGTDFQTATPNAWTATNDITTASQTNWMATIANTFQLTAIQIEAGSKATPFQIATGTFTTELAACQRYFAKSYLQGDAPATATSTNSVVFICPTASTGSMHQNVRYPVTMRTTPTLTLYDQLGASGKVYKGANGKTSDVFYTGDAGFAGGTADATSTTLMVFHYIASAEL
jgi:hypothetical protein